MKRFTAFLLALIILLPLLCGCGGKNKIDAIIILPGIMGSELYLSEDLIYDGKEYSSDTKLWLTLDTVKQIFAVPAHIEMLDINKEINIQTEDPIVNYYHERQNYGTLNTYGKLYKALYDEFGEECDVVFYSYDWREDPYDTARKLDSYLSDQDYDRVSIVAHSMGGLVASHFFAMGEEQREKIHTYLSLGTPYLGSAEAAYAMITGNIDSFFANILVSDEARALCPKLASMYALLPYSHLWQSYLSVYTITNKTPSESFSDEKELLEKYIENYSLNTHEYSEEVKSLLFTADGKHISELVNSYYLIGNGEKTAVTLNLPNDVRLASTLTTLTKEASGDGTVSAYSATIGGTLPADRTFVKSGGDDFLATHESLADGSDPTTLMFIISVLRGEVESLTDRDLKNDFNIKKTTP
ncbi:MAG: hypothetical protein J6S71_02205 [Clostridia bacterium]|nr:hypothetical protein [Clostridia bacterium]